MAPVEPAPPSAILAEKRRFVLHGIRWSTYEALLEDLEESHVQLTYDRGSLELVAPAFSHERIKKLFSRMIDATTEELNIPIRSGGSATFRRKLKKRGLEPDGCYWVTHEPQVREKVDIDLDVDPSPDLALEVGRTSDLLDKMSVYAGLEFPEVWWYDGQTIRVAHLQADGTYADRDRSPIFPFLPLAELVRFLELAHTMDETSWIRAFRAWVRAEVAPHFDEAADAGPHP